MSNRKRQFSGVRKPRLFYDRKVRIEGYTRSLSMGKVIPKDWRYVRITVLGRLPNVVHLTIEKLMGDEINAQTPRPNKTNK